MVRRYNEAGVSDRKRNFQDSDGRISLSNFRVPIGRSPEGHHEHNPAFQRRENDRPIIKSRQDG
jgi:hypothetical protein